MHPAALRMATAIRRSRTALRALRIEVVLIRTLQRPSQRLSVVLELTGRAASGASTPWRRLDRLRRQRRLLGNIHLHFPTPFEASRALAQTLLQQHPLVLLLRADVVVFTGEQRQVSRIAPGDGDQRPPSAPGPIAITTLTHWRSSVRRRYVVTRLRLTLATLTHQAEPE